MLDSYTQAGSIITRSVKFAKTHGGASTWLLSTCRIADLRRYVYGVCTVKGLEVPRYKTKTELAAWLLQNGPRLSESPSLGEEA